MNDMTGAFWMSSLSLATIQTLWRWCVTYVTKISAAGVWVQIGEMDAATPVDVNGKVLIVYNSKLVNVDAVDSRDPKWKN
jgi:hypothetical protein